MKNKLGVIGGMGSEATSYFFEELISHTKADKDQDHIDTIILNHATLPDRTEAILTGDSKELVELLVTDAKLLEAIGAKNIVIPCNTSHFFIEDIQKEVSIPIINMIQKTVQYAVKQFDNVQKIGLMATTGTIQSKVYHKEIKALGLDVVTPSPERQADVMSLIYDDVKSGKPGDYAKFQRTYDELTDYGSVVIILACTELSVFKKKNKVYDNCLDALDVLVNESIISSNAIYQ